MTPRSPVGQGAVLSGCAQLLHGLLCTLTHMCLAVVLSCLPPALLFRLPAQVLGVVENMSTLHISLDTLRFLHTPASTTTTTTSNGAATDLTAAVTSALQQALVDSGLVASLSDVTAAADIFLPTGGGAARMCEQLGLQLLGKVPLDPLLGQAAEEGKSVLAGEADDAVVVGAAAAAVAGAVNGGSAGPGKQKQQHVPPSAVALQAIVRQILQQVEGQQQ